MRAISPMPLPIKIIKSALKISYMPNIHDYAAAPRQPTILPAHFITILNLLRHRRATHMMPLIIMGIAPISLLFHYLEQNAGFTAMLIPCHKAIRKSLCHVHDTRQSPFSLAAKLNARNISRIDIRCSMGQKRNASSRVTIDDGLITKVGRSQKAPVMIEATTARVIT